MFIETLTLYFPHFSSLLFSTGQYPCTEMGEANYACQCPPGRYGHHCDYSYEECLAESSPRCSDPVIVATTSNQYVNMNASTGGVAFNDPASWIPKGEPNSGFVPIIYSSSV